MDDLEKAVEKQGIVWEDYKQQMKNGLLTQKVIQQEVGGRMDIGPDEIKKYYDAHKQDFVRAEQVDLSEIFLSTEGKTPEEIAAIKTKADDLHKRIVNGDDFAELAKRHSEGPTAQDGGELGTYERGQLAPQLADAVFKLDKNGITDVIQTKTGFEILKVNEHYQAGLQPLDKVSEADHQRHLQAEDGARDAQLSCRAARRELRHGEARIHGYGGGAGRDRDPGSGPDAGRGYEEEGQDTRCRCPTSTAAYEIPLHHRSRGWPTGGFALSGSREGNAHSQRTGTSWLHLELADRTGTIPAKMWENYATLAATFECDDVVQIRGRVKLYNGRKELTLEQIVPALERDYDLGDFLPHTKYDVEEALRPVARRRSAG